MGNQNPTTKFLLTPNKHFEGLYEPSSNKKSRSGAGFFKDFDEEKGYRGPLKNGKFEGFGESIKAPYGPRGDQNYVGDFVEGKYHGYGYLRFYQDDCEYEYSGQFERGLKHGFGKLFNRYSKSSYVGDFKNGLRHGHGIFTDHDGFFTYTGAW